jgi:hypothetical protein
MVDDLAIDVIVQAFDEPLGPDLIGRIREASHQALERSAEVYGAWSDRAVPPARTDRDALRPLIPLSAYRWLTDPDYARHGMDGSKTTDVFRASPLLKTVLLYAHAVALDNPLSRDVLSARSLLPHEGPPTAEGLESFRAALLAFVQFSAEVDALVRAGILVWLERGAGGGPYARPSPELELPPGSGVQKRSDLGYITPIAVRQSVEGCRFYGADEFDVFVPNFLGADVLQYAIRRDERIASPVGAEVESQRLAALLEMDVPSVNTLAFAEIAALRKSAESFADYRSNLRLAVETITTLAHDGASKQAQARAARELFAPTVLRLERELRQSWPHRVWAAVTKAGVGALVGEAANLTLAADSAPSPARVATNAVGDLLLEASAARSTRRLSRTLAAHYAVFAPSRIP